MADEQTQSIRVYKSSYTRMLGIVAYLERQRNRRVSMADVIEHMIKKYPNKKGK